jgi:hypothetical protein
MLGRQIAGLVSDSWVFQSHVDRFVYHGIGRYVSPADEIHPDGFMPNARRLLNVNDFGPKFRDPPPAAQGFVLIAG